MGWEQLCWSNELLQFASSLKNKTHAYNPKGFQSRKEYGYYILAPKYTCTQKYNSFLNRKSITEWFTTAWQDDDDDSVIIRSNHSNYNLPADTQTTWFTANIFFSTHEVLPKTRGETDNPYQ